MELYAFILIQLAFGIIVIADALWMSSSLVDYAISGYKKDKRFANTLLAFIILMIIMDSIGLYILL